MQTWHLTLALPGRERLFLDEDIQRRALLAVGRTLAERLLLFNLVDDHLHAVMLVERAEMGRRAQALSCALRVLCAQGLAPARIRPVEGRDHLESLVRYVLRQTVRHGLDVHPASWAGSCFRDLVGARLLPGFEPKLLRELLPRLRIEHLWALVDLQPPPPLQPEALRLISPTDLLGAAATTLVAPRRGFGADTLDARALVVRWGRAAGWTSRDLAGGLGVCSRTVRRLAQREVAEDKVRAAERNLALQRHLAQAPPVQLGERERLAVDRERRRWSVGRAEPAGQPRRYPPHPEGG